jgi:hypothetical protein
VGAEMDGWMDRWMDNPDEAKGCKNVKLLRN